MMKKNRTKIGEKRKKKKMSYQSVDELQKALADGVFNNRQDTKKAAGRALGTIVELITFYMLREWGLGSALTIELALPEFGHDAITHNVEFGLHSIISSRIVKLDQAKSPLTSRKVLAAIKDDGKNRRITTLISTDGVLRNACVLRETKTSFLTANCLDEKGGFYQVEIADLRKRPFAMVECKRVGIEDGMKKGPTTIEKAKQGAYVAKHVSSLQKIRNAKGVIYGAMAKPDGTIELRPWKEELKRMVYKGSVDDLAGFILTVGIVSNHGNWFTKDDPNKELLVLKHSYDWLLFLNDGGIAEFVSDTLLSKAPSMAAVRKAFEDSYVSGKAGNNRFTKVKISYDAHQVLCAYFHKHMGRMEKNWFSVLSPGDEEIKTLRHELKTLRDKNWK